mmetsp:Transcript_18993/g.8843  ORF Transcript_18993/g.8843 Transcript_18993/m.8843 type:complete len:83 (-) Transcript_18993:88-336(-)
MKGGVVNFVDFMEALQYKLGDNKTSTGLTRLFELLDYDNNGILDKTNLMRVAKEIGEHVTEEDIEELISDYYESPNGKINAD